MASSQQRVAKLLLRIESEQQNIQRAKQQIASFGSDFQRFKNESERVNVALEKQVSVLQRQKIAAAQAERATRGIGDGQRRVKQEVEQTTRAIESQATAVNREILDFQQEGRRQSFAVQNVQALLPGGGGEIGAAAAAAFNLLDTVPKLGASFEVLRRSIVDNVKAIGAPGLGLIGAGLALAAVMKLLAENAAAVRENVSQQITAQQTHLQLIRGGSKEEIEAEIARLNAQRVQAQAAFDVAQEAVKQWYEQAREQGTLTFAAIADLTGVQSSGAAELQAVRDAFEQAKATLAQVEGQVEAHTAALNSNEVQLRATIDANRAREEQLRKEFQTLQSNVSLQQLQTRIGLEQQSAAQARDRIAAIQREITLTQESLRTAALSAEATKQLQDRITLLSAEEQELARALPEKERMEAAANAFERIKQSVGNFVDEAQRRAADFQKAVRAIGDLRAGFDDRLADIERRRQQAIEDAATSRDQDTLKARRDSAIAEAEAVRKAGLDREKIELDSLQRQAAIVRRAKFSIENAIQDRDAVALDLARRTRKNELGEEKSNRRERLRQLDNSLKEELRTIRRRLSQQILTIDESYSEQVRRAALAAQRSVAVETQKFQRELAIRAQALQAALGIEQRGAQAHLNLQANFWGNSLKLASSAVQQLSNMRVQAAQVQQFNRSSPTPRGGGFAPSLQTGGRILSDGLVFAHAGEMVVNPRQQGQGVNFTFAPQLNGASLKSLRAEMNREFDDFVLSNF